MTKTSDLDDMMQALERVRMRLHPDVPADLVRQVLNCEHENQETHQQALSAIRRVLGVRDGKVGK